jgi:16S rRNA (uracil1498-N3)-methyltransferase
LAGGREHGRREFVRRAGVSTPPLFLVDDLDVEDGGLVLDGPEGRHAASVRRLRPGERLLVSDGRGAVASCEVEALQGREALRLTVHRRWREPAPAPRVVLAQALVKGDRGELAVELATEAGVDEVLPWRAARCVARWEAGERGAKALARWRATAREAAKQARRAWLPAVGDPVDTPTLARRVRAAAGAIVLHESAGTPLRSVPLPARGELLLVVGPEGGIADDELAALVDAGAVAARLGPTVLRASTAAAVALGALGVLTERWILSHSSGQ